MRRRSRGSESRPSSDRKVERRTWRLLSTGSVCYPPSDGSCSAFHLRPQRRLGATIDALGAEPRPPGSKLLTDKAKERIWRVRQGEYRILYEILNRELLVLVIRIGYRRDIYRRL